MVAYKSENEVGCPPRAAIYSARKIHLELDAHKILVPRSNYLGAQLQKAHCEEVSLMVSKTQNRKP